jgi:hypothetical protein
MANIYANLKCAFAADKGIVIWQAFSSTLSACSDNFELYFLFPSLAHLVEKRKL